MSVEIASETFGDPSKPALLLIMGASASMLWWPDGLCARLAAAGRFVIRYDNRDTGCSTTYPPGQPGYTLDDMVGDAVTVLDQYQVPRAHIVGMSLGGIIGQMLARRNPDRVVSLTLIASTPFGPEAEGLPQIDPKILEYHQRAASLDWSDREAVVDYMASGWALLSGSAHPCDMELTREIAAREVARARNLPSMFNHAFLKDGGEWWGQLDSIKVPVLILHGTEDPVLPFPHAEALAKAIPGSNLVPLPGTGHELHPADWDRMCDAILTHTAPAASLS